MSPPRCGPNMVLPGCLHPIWGGKTSTRVPPSPSHDNNCEFDVKDQGEAACLQHGYLSRPQCKPTHDGPCTFLYDCLAHPWLSPHYMTPPYLSLILHGEGVYLTVKQRFQVTSPPMPPPSLSSMAKPPVFRILPSHCDTVDGII